jgi:hypothetical protein
MTKILKRAWNFKTKEVASLMLPRRLKFLFKGATNDE